MNETDKEMLARRAEAFAEQEEEEEGEAVWVQRRRAVHTRVLVGGVVVTVVLGVALGIGLGVALGR